MIKEIYSNLPEGVTKNYFKSYIIKIDSGLLNPGYVNTGLNKIENKLGFSDMSEQSQTKPDFITKRLDAYNKWLQDPLQITESEFDLVQTYRYENSLMTKEEEVEYENKLFGV